MPQPKSPPPIYPAPVAPKQSAPSPFVKPLHVGQAGTNWTRLLGALVVVFMGSTAYFAWNAVQKPKPEPLAMPIPYVEQSAMPAPAANGDDAAAALPAGVVARRELPVGQGSKVAFVHSCAGEIKTVAAAEGGLLGAGQARYCVGKNTLTYVGADEKTVVVSESEAKTMSDAPVLLDAFTFAPTTGLGDPSYLVEYGVIPCTLSSDTCGAGLPSNYVSHVVDAGTLRARELKNFPAFGTAVWNDSGTKAFFPVEQVGGAGCDRGPIVGYDLAKDAKKDLTAETGCPFAGGRAADVTGATREPEWGPSIWVGNDTVKSIILGTDHAWKVILTKF